MARLRWRRHRVHHAGEGLPGRITPAVKVKAQPSSVAMAWRCAFCRQGITKAERGELTFATYCLARRRHRRTHHPKVTDRQWRQAHRANRPAASHASRVQRLNGVAGQHLQTAKALEEKGVVPFAWPRLRPDRRTKKTKLTITTGWSAGGGRVFYDATAAKAFDSTTGKIKNSKRRLAALEKARKWAMANQTHGMTEEALGNIFRVAKQHIKGESQKQ
jgi:hypothetical protein